jgi:hypothetical protein
MRVGVGVVIRRQHRNAVKHLNSARVVRNMVSLGVSWRAAKTKKPYQHRKGRKRGIEHHHRGR